MAVPIVPVPVVSVMPVVPLNVLVAVRVISPVELFVPLFVVIESAPASVRSLTTAPPPTPTSVPAVFTVIAIPVPLMVVASA